MIQSIVTLTDYDSGGVCCSSSFLLRDGQLCVIKVACKFQIGLGAL
jgi:hypothetical protein